MDTGYGRLPDLGSEAQGYGLYSYVLIPIESQTTVSLLREIFKVIPSVTNIAAKPIQTNLLYLPFRKDKQAEFRKFDATKTDLATAFAKSFYDYKLSRAIILHLCNRASMSMQTICQGDMSQGPFIFTYFSPASKMDPVVPPYLFVDLRNINPKAYPEFVSAFQEQVKTEDVSGGQRLNTLRLRLLNIVLTAADWTTPVQKAMGDIVHSILPDGK